MNPPLLVDEYDGTVLLRCSPQSAPAPDHVAELARSLAAADCAARIATVVVGVDGDGPVPPALWNRLAVVC